MVVYAEAAPRTPMRATPTALRRWADVTWFGLLRPVEVVALVEGSPSLAPLATGGTVE